MAKYKVLKSVAHNVVHSFTSDMNYGDGDYVMSHLVKEMLRTGDDNLQVDLLSGAAGPEALLVPAVRASIARYTKRFAELVSSHKTSLAFVRAAEMQVSFDLHTSRPMRVAPNSVEYPFVGVTTITDDRGKMWVGKVAEWWSPDAGMPIRFPGGEPIAPRLTFWQRIRSALGRRW